ncbi:MAG TPA: sugar ABC transporter permease [Mesotoga infera]|jgi:multiple sugar transport system permease protein|uniref:Permease component of ABC-type sugar transporter n=1 Tax=Mesotoga infera TaxID=1236046 RepID=A0A7Z7PNZ6_9BACT|nr:sugar ABC transporter permease [Mesotoga infera]MBP8660807.1 sugar ABC transporter permease [Mesotoga sp.]NLI06737.1 sugar ABC transporter permease [Thermotogaceae bacterium]SSC12811.1 Permease component of ABC-type sugar transporter [Mesotoga infera]HON29186.1 sugar ABC transporter permease [Mesotoga infera]HPD39480.1 sugar ABC transporter permease [Mesotoga infera]
MQSVSTMLKNENRLGWRLVSPTVVLLMVLILYPVVYNIYISFFDYGITRSTFVGIDNYLRVLKDGAFWKSFFITIGFTLMTVGGSLLLGLGVALMLNKEFKGRSIVRTIVLLPYITPLISIVFSWQYIFDPSLGPFVEIFGRQLGWISPQLDLLNNSNNAFIVASVFNIWRNFPFVYLMILSRLQSIPDEYYEAAEMDGATPWKKFTNITLPELYFVMGAVALMRGIWNFYKFDEVYLISKKAGTLPIFIYERVIGTTSPEFGVAAAIATVLMVIMLGLITMYVKKVLKW